MAAGPGASRDQRSVMEFVPVPETIARWVPRDQCSASPQSVLQVPDAGGHSWAGADSVRQGKEAAATALGASAAIWPFFDTQPPRPAHALR